MNTITNRELEKGGLLDSASTLPFKYRFRGQLSSIGHNKAVAEIGGVRLSDFIA
jgi:NADH dehydrogenase FAD-containing subunit